MSVANNVAVEGQVSVISFAEFQAYRQRHHNRALLGRRTNMKNTREHRGARNDEQDVEQPSTTNEPTDPRSQRAAVAVATIDTSNNG